MPVRRVIDAELEDTITDIERGRHSIVAVAPAGPGAWVVVYTPTRARTGKETR